MCSAVELTLVGSSILNDDSANSPRQLASSKIDVLVLSFVRVSKITEEEIEEKTFVVFVLYILFFLF